MAGRRRVAWHAVATSAALHVMAVFGLLHYYSLGTQGIRPELVPLAIHLVVPRREDVPEFSKKHEPVRDVPVNRPPVTRPPAVESQSAREQRMDASPAVSAPAPATLGVDAMIDAAKRNIGNIDKELRQAFPSRAQVPLAPSPLEKGIAAAGVSRGSTIQELVLGDGRRVTKVITSSGTYCVLGRKPGAGIAENEVAAMTTTTCPN